MICEIRKRVSLNGIDKIPCYITVDENKFRQILINLLRNAVFLVI